jgi:GTPase Era involved in 16S rRNA processing
MQFVNIATKQDGHTVGHGLVSNTSDIRAVRVNHRNTNDAVIFIDTPGFDDTFKSYTEVLTTIAEWFIKTWVLYIG